MNTLLFIDPHFGMISPSLKSTLRECPECFADFDEVEVWAIECDFEHSKIKLDRVYCPFRSWHLVSLWYWVAVHWRYFWRYVCCRKKRATVIQATNYYCYAADLVYFHFSFLAYRRIIQKHCAVFQLSLPRRVIFWMHYVKEWILFRIAAPRWWWVVSRQLMEESQESTSSECKFRVLPNSYDRQRFQAKVREQHRDAMRDQLGFSADESVFIFVSLGDLERKGFGLAAQAVSSLHQQGLQVKMLFVGGPTPEPLDLGPFLKAYGVDDLSFLKVVGRVTNIERYMAAADALLFPSYCEAFALVEIEAAAMGLRLYLTPHYGSEMIMREPVNGRFLPWDVTEMAEVLREEIVSGQCRAGHAEMGEALSREQFLPTLRERYREILRSKNALVSE
jgi:glycosyltransferase involved in cell wall biosynthesis